MGKNIGKNNGKNVSKNLSGKYHQNFLDHAKQSATDVQSATNVLKTPSKRVIQKNIERYISPEDRHRIIDDLRLI